MPQTAYRELDLQEDMTAQKRLWRFQQFGIALMAVWILASLLGLTGPGALSKKQAGDPATLQIEYDRMIHYEDMTELKIDLGPELQQNGEAAVSMSREYLKNFRISRITPEPVKVEGAEDFYKYTFHTSNSEQPLQVIFHFEASERGRLRGQIKAGEAEPLEISQFAFP